MLQSRKQPQQCRVERDDGTGAVADEGRIRARVVQHSMMWKGVLIQVRQLLGQVDASAARALDAPDRGRREVG